MPSSVYRRELLPGRIAVWFLLLVGAILIDGRNQWRGGYAAVWLTLVVVSAALMWLAARGRAARVAVPLVELMGTTLLVAFAGGVGSGLSSVYLVLAGSYFLAYSPGLATALGALAVCSFDALAGLELIHGEIGPADAPGVLLAGLALGFFVVLGSILSRQVLAANSGAADVARQREREREGVARTASAMLQATNAFLRCDDFAQLAETALDACQTVFEPARAMVAFRTDDVLSPIGWSGMSDAQVARMRAVLASPNSFSSRLDAGEELWADVEPMFASSSEQMGVWGGFAVPFRSSGVTKGALIVAYSRPRDFGESFREATSTLAGQIALAYELIDARAAIRADAQELAGEAERLEQAVTDRTLQLNEAIRELQIANQAKSEFLANVSHELRTPLTSILGFGDVLLRGLDGPLNTDQQDDLRTIHNSSRHLLDLIDDLIDIARIEAGGAELQRQFVALRPILVETIRELRPQAAEKGLNIRLKVGPVPEAALVDPGRFRQILINLVGNAIKFTQAGSVTVVAGLAPPAASAGSVRRPGSAAGRPEASAGRAAGALSIEGAPGAPAGPAGAAGPAGPAGAAGAAGAAASQRILTIEVVDTGPGIAAPDLERIFEKFQRAAGPDQPGTGLGLSIAREFARLHGGDVLVQSTVGIGSHFTLRIPLVEERVASADALPAMAGPDTLALDSPLALAPGRSPVPDAAPVAAGAPQSDVAPAGFEHPASGSPGHSEAGASRRRRSSPTPAGVR